MEPLLVICLAWAGMLCIVALVAFFSWLANALWSLRFSASLAACRRGQPVCAKGKRGYQAKDFSALPALGRPFYSYERKHGLMDTEELPDPTEALIQFEADLTAAAPAEMFFARFEQTPVRGKRLCSLVAVYPLGTLSHGLAWVTLERRGPVLEWMLHYSEVRSWRTPTEGRSHFSKKRPFEVFWLTRLVGDLDGLVLTWNALTLANLSESGARRAEYLERFTQDVWAEVLHRSQRVAPRPRSSAVRPPHAQSVPSAHGAPSVQGASSAVSGARVPHQPRRPQYRG